MPGIVGIIGHESPDHCRSLVETMLGSMKHEQFYRSATYSAPHMGVYAGSMALDSPQAGHVFFNERKDVALILSGECFFDSQVGNELRQKGHQVGETRAGWLLHLYEEEGDRVFENVNGLFSGLLIDQGQGKAFLFNDRYGSERIYWHETQGTIYFASEAKALLRVLPELREFDKKGVAQFLTYGCTFGGRTLFRNIQVLPGASLWSFENGRCQKRKYFSPAEWEAQAALSAEDFMARFQETFKRILPRYFDSQAKIGISLTGGLDTRMIMACRPDTVEKPVCYTFSGETGYTMDDRLAHRVAKVCGLEHELLRIESDFFSDFASHVDRTVYMTDGCFGAIGAHEIYLNKKARKLAPVRLTGNYGSEVLRGVSTLKPLGLSRSLFNLRFALNHSAAPDANGSRNPITLAAFTEIPSSLYGSLAAGRSQVRLRTPYLDNEIVALAYQAPENLRRSPLPAWRLIEANSPPLSKIPTDRGRSRQRSGPAATLRRFFSEATFKLDYLNNEGCPNWLSPFEPIFKGVTSKLGIVGLHKYLHYRSWFRDELSDCVKSVVSDVRIQQGPFWNPDFLEDMAREHIGGRKNYVLEINAVLTLEAVERLLFRDLSCGTSDLRDSDSENSRKKPLLAG